jgi:hypothetical protein
VQVVIHGRTGAEEAIQICQRNGVCFLRGVDLDVVKNICFRVYGQRVALIDNQIKTILNASK